MGDGPQAVVLQTPLPTKHPLPPRSPPPLHGTVGVGVWSRGVGVWLAPWWGELGDAGRRGVGEEASHFQTSEALLCPQDLSLWGWCPLPHALYFL